MKKLIGLFSIIAYTALFGQSITVDQLLELNRLNGGQTSPDGKKVLFEVKKANILENKMEGNTYILDLATKKQTAITANSSVSRYDYQWTKDQKIWFVSTEKNGAQVWNMNADGSKQTQVTNEAEGIEGFKISSDGKLMVLIIDQKIEKTITENYDGLTKHQAKIYDDLMYRHWDYWNDEKYKQLYYVQLENNQITSEKKIIGEKSAIDKVNPPFSGSESIAIHPDNNTIYFSMKNKKGMDFALSTNTDIYRFDIQSNTIQNISSANKGYDNYPTISTDGKFLAWLQMKNDGFEADKNDLILYDIARRNTINLTATVDMTVDQFIFGEDKIFFISPTKGCAQIFEVNLKTKKIAQLTNDRADYISLSYANKQLIVGKQSLISPTDLFQIDLINQKQTALTNVNEAFLKTIKLPTVTENWVKTTDGKDMLVWHVLPPNFDSTVKYPTLLYCQGGPQGMVSQFFSYRWNLMLMASQGYVVVAPNRRGLPGFGQEWNDQISKDWGGQAIKDYLSAIDEAATRSYVNKDKLGAVGASYGGYSVYYLAGVHNKRFKTFISHCGLFNLESWYGTTEELFFANWDNKGPYWEQENKEYYIKNSPHNFVQNWDTPIFVIHGEKDYRVPLTEGLQAYQAAKLKGLKTKLLLFSNEGHWVSSPQNAKIWHTEFFKWLDSDLK